MSFLSILKTIGKDLVAADVMAAPYVSMFNPAVGTAMSTIGQLVVKAEVTIQGEKQGTSKKQMVLDEFQALLPMVTAALKDQAGLTLTIDSGAISQLIDSTVAQLNAAKAFQAGFKIAKAA